MAASSEAPDSSAAWAIGAAYEPYVGRWSRLVAARFLSWLPAPPASSWLDAGCGTGALTETILRSASPRSAIGLDRSEQFVAFAREHVRDPKVRFETGDMQALPFASATFDAVVSGLALNFVPDQERAARELVRVAHRGGIVGVYLWDYAGKMQFMRYFWDAAATLDPSAASLDEGRRFPICQPEPLALLFQTAGLHAVTVTAIDIDTVFRDFDDYWTPFLGAQGPAPAYTMSLDKKARAALRERLRATLPTAADGSIPLVARAWAVRGEA